MMLRTPPVKQKRSSPSLSSPLLLHAKQVHQMKTVVESKSSPSPSKRLRRPLGVGIEDPDEPFSLRSLHRGSPWGTAQQSLEHGGQHIEDLSIKPHHATRKTLISDDDSEPELDWDSLRCSYKCRNLVKSDVLMSLDSREKQVVELKATLDKLRAAYATSDEDRKKLKKMVYGLEQGLAAAKERETALYKQRTQESAKNGEQIRTHMACCAELEVHYIQGMHNLSEQLSENEHIGWLDDLCCKYVGCCPGHAGSSSSEEHEDILFDQKKQLMYADVQKSEVLIQNRCNSQNYEQTKALLGHCST
ncbi:unnamed protein product [Calypogeia fissa]